MKVELIYDPSCPHVDEARAQLSEAFAQVKARPRWKEWNLRDPKAPARVRGFGSPTILVDGRDASEQGSSSAGPTCRIYREGNAMRGAPSAQTIAAMLSRHQRSKSWIAVLPALGASFLPNVACPACWPAYAGVVGSMGLGFLLDAAYLLPLTAVALAVAVGALAFRARSRRGFGPLLLGAAGAAATLFGKFGSNREAIMYAGVALLVAASVWNGWPRRTPSTCATCEPSSVPSEV